MRGPVRSAAAAQRLCAGLLLAIASASHGSAASPDLCAGLATDREPRRLMPLKKPAPRGSVVDPAFGTTIRRITAVPVSQGENAVIKPMYSTVPAWNADESLLVLWRRGAGHELYDGRSYAFSKLLPLESPTDLEQVLWDPLDPDVLYYPSNHNAEPRLMRHHVRRGTNDVVRRFEQCPSGDWGQLLSLGSDPMYLSWNASRVIGLSCGPLKFLYEVASDTVIGQMRLATRNAPQPGPGGRTAFLDGVVYDGALRRLTSLELGNPYEHASIGRSGITGHDTYNAVAFDPPSGGSEAADVGTLVSHDMTSGERRVLIGFATGFPYPPSGTHVSALGLQVPGWVAVSVVGDPRRPALLDNELLLANVDSGAVCRVAHHRSFAGEGRWGYWGEPHVVISPSGTRLLFGSDWGDGPSVDSYVVELPSYSR